MNDPDASDGELHAAVVMPRLKKELHLVDSEEADEDTEPDQRQRNKREYQENDTATVMQTPKKRAKRKYRKSTIDIRKEEIACLLKELAALHSRMEQLNARAMKPRTAEETPTEAAVANKVLRRAIQKQQLEVTHFHALMSEYSLFFAKS
eukprot:jgi/Phyca11/14342/fgenesh1_pg.PHYCAscaffold_7_\